MTFQSGGFQPADTAPYDGLTAAVVPVDSSEQLSALAADDDLGETVVAAVAALLAIGAGFNNTSADQFFLYTHIDFFWNNGFVVSFNIILGHKAVILYSGLIQEVCGIGLLQKSVTDIFFIS